MTAAGGAQSAAPAPFADLMTDAVGQVNQLEAAGAVRSRGLMTGTGVDVHHAMIATEKADMAFELALAVHNKAVQAYQSGDGNAVLKAAACQLAGCRASARNVGTETDGHGNTIGKESACHPRPGSGRREVGGAMGHGASALGRDGCGRARLGDHRGAAAGGTHRRARLVCDAAGLAHPLRRSRPGRCAADGADSGAGADSV